MIKIGDTVLCRLYNTPERKFYGEYFTSEVLDILYPIGDEKHYLVKRPPFDYEMWLHRKEIKRIIKKG